MNLNKIIGFALGPIASAAFGLITVPVVAWVFTPEDVGRLNMLRVVMSFSLLLLVLGLDQAYVREFHEARNRPELLNACFSPGFLLLLVGILATFAFSSQLSQWLFGVANPLIYRLVLLGVVANYVSRFLSLILRMQERGLAFSMSQVIPQALQLILLGGVVATGLQRDFLSLLWIAVASMVAVVAVYSWNTRQQWFHAIAARPSLRQTRSLLKFGLPLVVSGLAYWGLAATSTIVLRSQSTLTELGIYSVTSSFAGVAAIFSSIFNVIWAPTVYKWVAEGVDMKRVDRVACQALAVVSVLFTLIGTFSWLIDYILPPNYIDVKYMVLCAIAPPLIFTLSEITSVGIGITRRTMLTVWITLAALITNVLINLWLVPTYGAAGAVIANAVAYLVFFVARTEASAHVWHQFPRRRLYVFVSSAVTFSVGTVALASAIPFHYAFAWFAALPVVTWCFRVELRDMVAFGRHAWCNRRVG